MACERPPQGGRSQVPAGGGRPDGAGAGGDIDQEAADEHRGPDPLRVAAHVYQPGARAIGTAVQVDRLVAERGATLVGRLGWSMVAGV